MAGVRHGGGEDLIAAVTRTGDGPLQHPLRGADAFRVRVSLLVYGVLYAVMEMVGYQLRVVGFAHVTALDVATALTDAFLVVVICAAVVLTVHLGFRRWQQVQADRPHEAPIEAHWDDEPIEVTAWRPTPEEMAEPASPPPTSKGTYPGNPYAFGGSRWPTEPGRQL